MKLTLNTRVNEDFRVVFSGFDRDLFLKLAPPLPRVTLKRFDGCNPGDKVEIIIDTLLMRQNWTSLITEQVRNDYEIYFTDEGQQLPKPLTFWRHKHLLSKNGRQTRISDQIEYRTNSVFLDYLLYPFLYLQFAYRQPIYRKTFDRNKRLGLEKLNN